VAALACIMCLWATAAPDAQAAKTFKPGFDRVMQIKVPAGQSETVKSASAITNLVVGDP
jgi:hypothetical protein